MLKRSVSVLSLFLAAGAATAQVATPPPKANPETPEFTVPEPRPATPRAATPQPTRVVPNPTDPNLKDENVPPVQYKKLAVVGTDGKIIRFDVPLDYEALRNNPLYGESNVSRIMPMLVGRRYRMETVAIDNLDFVLKIENGLIDDLAVDNVQAMKDIVDTVTPLVPPKSVTQEMFDRGLISPVQQRFNQKLIGEFQNDIMAELTAENPNTGLGEFMKYLMGESLKEAMIAYEGLLAESTWRIQEVLEKAGLQGTPAAQAMSSIQGGIESDPETIRANAQMIRDAWGSWDLSQKQSFLRAVQDTREDPRQPPIPVIDIRNEDLIDQTGQGKDLGVTRKGSPVPPSSRKEPGEGG